MLNKIKKSLNDAKDKTAKNFQYAKSKTTGFKHPDNVEYHINIIRANRDSIPKLYDRVSCLCENEKSLADAEFKAHAEWVMLSDGSDCQNLADYMRAWGNCQLALSEARSNYHLSIDEIKEDFKMFKNMVTEIQVVHDKTNHALNDAMYWRNHSNIAKFELAESKYISNLESLMEMKNEMMSNKGQKFENYIVNWNNAEIEFYTKALEAAKELQNQIRAIGPVISNEQASLDLKSVNLTQFYISEKSKSSKQFDNDEYANNLNQTPGTRTSVIPQTLSNTDQVPTYQTQFQNAQNPITAVAISDFAARNEKELSFRTGDNLLIKTKSENWSLAELNGNVGFVPSNYVKFSN